MNVYEYSLARKKELPEGSSAEQRLWKYPAIGELEVSHSSIS
jgi:hypothetical protein